MRSVTSRSNRDIIREVMKNADKYGIPQPESTRRKGTSSHTTGDVDFTTMLSQVVCVHM